MNSMLQVCLQNQCLKEVQQNHTLACFSMYLAEYRLNRLLPPERATDLRTVETFKPCGGGSKSVYGHSFHAEIPFQNVLNLFFDV